MTTYSYDGMDRLNQIVVSSGTNTLWAERYGFNAVGERIYTLTGTTGTVGEAYRLDATSQLVGVKYGAAGADSGYASATSPASVAAWNYDASGNRETQVIDSGTTSYTVNTINQYTKLEGTAPSVPTYSTRGDLATKGHWEYDYDAFGNLIQAHNTNSNVLAKYWRDAFGHRAVKEVDGSKTVYFNFGIAQLEAYDLTAATTTSTIYEPGIDRPLAEVSDSGTVTFYHQDWLGSVVMLTDSSGAKVQSYTYDAWGEVSGFDGTGTPIADSAIDSRWLYTAREFDLETGHYHYRARGYSSGLGRFSQNDPIDFAGGNYNLLRYVSNNPINWVDPIGSLPRAPNGKGFKKYFEELVNNYQDAENKADFINDVMDEMGADEEGRGPLQDALEDIFSGESKDPALDCAKICDEFSAVSCLAAGLCFTACVNSFN